MTTGPSGEPEKKPSPLGRFDHYPGENQPDPNPLVTMKQMLWWLIALTIVNIALSGYVADFVHQLTGG